MGDIRGESNLSFVLDDGKALSMFTPEWECLLQHEVALRRLCRRSCRGIWYLEDELFSDVVLDRWHRVYELHHPNIGKMMNSLRLYMWKYMNRRYKKQHAPLVEEVEVLDVDLATHEWVQHILGRLSPEDRQVLEMRHLNDLNFPQMAQELNCCCNTAVNRYNRAIKNARKII